MHTDDDGLGRPPCIGRSVFGDGIYQPHPSLIALGKLLQVHGFFENGVGVPASTRRAVWGVNAGRAWGTLLIAYDLVDATHIRLYSSRSGKHGRSNYNKKEAIKARFPLRFCC